MPPSPSAAPKARDAAEAEVYEALATVGLRLQDLAFSADSPPPAPVREALRLLTAEGTLSDHGHFALERLRALALARAQGTDEAHLGREFDIIDGEGNLVLRRRRADVHRGGLWHRAVHVWVVCQDTCRVLIGQRAPSKHNDPLRWTCACGRVAAGDMSMATAVDLVDAEFSIKATPDVDLSLAFSLRCSTQIARGLFAGHLDNTIVDVYILRLEEEVPVQKVHFDHKSKHDVQYVSLEELQRALESRDEMFMIPPNDEYVPKLIQHLRRTCEIRGAALTAQHTKARIARGEMSEEFQGKV